MSTTDSKEGIIIEDHKMMTYHNNALNGPYKKWFGNGKLHISCTYVNGKRHGKYIKYHSNGNIWMIVDYYQDAIHGSYQVFNTNGDIEVTKYFRYNQLLYTKRHILSTSLM